MKDVAVPGAPLLAYYEQLQQNSEYMIEAARLHDWARLQELEQQCGELIQNLQHALRYQQLSPRQQGLKGRIMVQILKNDARIRQLAGCTAGMALLWPDPPPRTVH